MMATLIAAKRRCSPRPPRREIQHRKISSSYSTLFFKFPIDTASKVHSIYTVPIFIPGLISVGSSSPLRETAGALDAFNLPLVSVVSPHSDGDDADDIAQGRKEIVIAITTHRAHCSFPPLQ